MHAHSPAQHEVAADPQDDKERTEHNEVDVESCVFDVQSHEDVFAGDEHAHARIVFTAIKRFAIEPVDGLEDALERES